MRDVTILASILFATLSLPTLVMAESVAVELVGVSILGSNKKAVIEMGGVEHSIHEGGQLGGYLVQKIMGRSVLLVNSEGGEFLLDLKSRSAIPQQTRREQKRTPSGYYENPKILFSPPKPEKIGKGVYRGNPVFVKDEDIPPGYKRVRSFLGDYLVKE